MSARRTREKICKHCNKKKKLSSFIPDERSKDGYSHWCIHCVDHFKKLKKGRNIEEFAERRKEYRERCNEIKARYGCNKCKSEFDPYALEFHHRNPEEKVASVHDLIKEDASWDKILDEIDKCDVLCSNCHKKVERQKFLEEKDKESIDIYTEPCYNGM